MLLRRCKSRRVRGLTELFRKRVPHPSQDNPDPVGTFVFQYPSAFEELTPAGAPSPLVTPKPRSYVKEEVHTPLVRSNSRTVSFQQTSTPVEPMASGNAPMPNFENPNLVAPDQPLQPNLAAALQAPVVPLVQADGDPEPVAANPLNEEDQAQAAAEADLPAQGDQPPPGDADPNQVANQQQEEQFGRIRGEIAELRDLIRGAIGRVRNVDHQSQHTAERVAAMQQSFVDELNRNDRLHENMHEVSTRVTVRGSDPNPTKLRAYSKEKEDFSLFESRFRAMWRTANWSDDRALSELINNLQTARAERVVRSKPSSEWTAETLLNACSERLGADLNLAQVRAQLFEITLRMDESPDDAMCRIEDVIAHAKFLDRDRPELMRIQRQAFLRLIHAHEPMYFFVCDNSRDEGDPYDALNLAKQYLRTRGHETDYFNKLVERRLEKLGIESGSENKGTDGHSRTLSKSEDRKSKTDSSIQVSAFKELCSKVDHLTQTQACADQASVDARYLQTNTMPDDWYKKLTSTINEHERKARILQSEMQKMVDGLKNAGQYKPVQPADQTKTSVSYQSKPNFKPPESKTWKSDKTKQTPTKPNHFKPKRKDGNDRTRKPGSVNVYFMGSNDMVAPDNSDTEVEEDNSDSISEVDERQE